jgi:hypothetical protein
MPRRAFRRLWQLILNQVGQITPGCDISATAARRLTPDCAGVNEQRRLDGCVPSIRAAPPESSRRRPGPMNSVGWGFATAASALPPPTVFTGHGPRRGDQPRPSRCSGGENAP